MRIMFSAFIILFACLLSCKKNGDIKNGDKLLDLNQCAPAGIGSLPKICFDSLVTDSRCPANAVCIWQGIVIVKLSLTDHNGSQSFYLSSFKNSMHFPANDTTINGYNIKLLDVTYKVQNGEPALLPQMKLQVQQ